MFSKEESGKVKGVAILLLIFHHMFYNADRVAQSGMRFKLFSESIIEPIAVSARICVWIFVFLSAYGLSFQYFKKKDSESKMQYILTHWFSLMKTYWFVYILILALYWMLGNSPFELYENSIVKMILDFLGIADFFGTPMITAVWWYMCFAQILVFFIPILSELCRKTGWSIWIVAFFVLQYISSGIVSPYGGYYSSYLLAVLAGILCAEKQTLNKILSHNQKDAPMIRGGKAIILLLLIIILLYIKYKLTNIDQWQLRGMISAIVSILICIFVSGYCTNIILGKILIVLGKYSGAMFMTHTFLMTFFAKIVYWSGDPLISYCSLTIISLLFSVLVEQIMQKVHYTEGINYISGFIIQKTQKG